MRPIDRVLETVLYVDDLDAAARFYGDVLGLELDSRKDGLFAFFKCGGGMLLLFEPQAASTGRSVPAHGASGPGHVCFAVGEDDLDGWKAHLEEAGVAIEQHIDWPRGGRSFYFRDPAGNSLELATPKIWDLPDVQSG
jgi:catechol 2,3-dioxygenase-like lactoylglutathione lyase family enzyme